MPTNSNVLHSLNFCDFIINIDRKMSYATNISIQIKAKYVCSASLQQILTNKYKYFGKTQRLFKQSKQSGSVSNTTKKTGSSIYKIITTNTSTNILIPHHNM